MGSGPLTFKLYVKTRRFDWAPRRPGRINCDKLGISMGAAGEPMLRQPSSPPRVGIQFPIFNRASPLPGKPLRTDIIRSPLRFLVPGAASFPETRYRIYQRNGNTVT